MPNWIDGALYPDTDVPDELPTLADRVDFLARLCSAWDFGLLPDRETVEEIRRLDWYEAVDATRLPSLSISRAKTLASLATSRR